MCLDIKFPFSCFHPSNNSDFIKSFCLHRIVVVIHNSFSSGRSIVWCLFPFIFIMIMIISWKNEGLCDNHVVVHTTHLFYSHCILWWWWCFFILCLLKLKANIVSQEFFLFFVLLTRRLHLLHDMQCFKFYFKETLNTTLQMISFNYLKIS